MRLRISVIVASPTPFARAGESANALAIATRGRCISCAMPNVTIVAALLAGMLSFLSPCVLPLVPPYLVYLTGTSLERFAERRPSRGCGARRCGGASCSCSASPPCSSRSAPAPARSARCCAPIRASSPIVAGIVIIVMGLHFLGLTPIAWLMREKRFRLAKPVGLVGRLSDGACLCARLDAVHRADPRRDPRRRGVRGDGGQRRRHARGLFARPRHAVHHRGAGGRSRSRRSSPASALISGWSKRRWAGSWCSPASRS